MILSLQSYLLFLNADTCGGRNSVSSSWDEGLACYQCHVHIGNDHVDLVNKANKTSESELVQLSNCDADRGDVTRKYVAAHSRPNSSCWNLVCVTFLIVIACRVFRLGFRLPLSFPLCSSRLSCQITLTPELDGMLVLIPTFPEEDTV